MTGTIIDDKNIIEYKTAQLLLSPQDYSISYTLSGQPTQHVIPNHFSKRQVEDRDFVEKQVRKDIYG